MATNDQTRRVEFPNVPPRINAPGAPKPPGKPMPKKSGDDAKWMAGLAAVLGLGLGGGVAYAAGTFDGDDGPTDAPEPPTTSSPRFSIPVIRLEDYPSA